MRLPESFLQELKARTDMTELVSSYVNLRRSGRNLVGLCMSFTRIIPGYNGMTEAVLTQGSQWAPKINTLTDTKGNALQFAQAKSQWQTLGYAGQIQQGAYSKVLDILEQMDAARGGEASSQTFAALENSNFWSGANTGESRLAVSSLMGDLSSFQFAIDRVKSKRIQMV